jgi:hypothetical protein
MIEQIAIWRDEILGEIEEYALELATALQELTVAEQSQRTALAGWIALRTRFEAGPDLVRIGGLSFSSPPIATAVAVRLTQAERDARLHDGTVAAVKSRIENAHFRLSDLRQAITHLDAVITKPESVSLEPVP